MTQTTIASYGGARADITRGTDSATDSNIVAIGGGTHAERLALVHRVMAELDRQHDDAVCRVGLCVWLRGASLGATRREAAISAAVKAVQS